MRQLTYLGFFLIPFSLISCGSIQEAAQEDCAGAGYRAGSADYNSCVSERIRERNADYSNTFLPSNQGFQSTDSK
ncbi:hypothetical protein [Polynucleobacter sp. IMCC 30228]|uniref:hypothetical protein n=1 Tax=Polynucleobacter sp. IMCC 30228 TaxID=2781011 RepID=UPI001F2941B3|nr:hypothetical protein [Polynucleobacter sp. IMCC 30228]MCE7528077.1 hypothetical protein [Polynucleobacter sp. IMCC 30228]